MATSPQGISDAIAKAQDEVKAVWEKHQAANPQLNEWAMAAKIHCFKKRPSGYFKVYWAIMERLTWKGWVDKTQVDILKNIKPSFPQHNIPPTIWQDTLTASQRRKMQTYLNGNDLNAVSTRGCQTLADVKERIRAHVHSADATHKFSGTIAIDDRIVIVGKTTYKIEARKHPSIRVTIGKDRLWLRVDMLTALLK